MNLNDLTQLNCNAVGRYVDLDRGTGASFDEKAGIGDGEFFPVVVQVHGCHYHCESTVIKVPPTTILLTLALLVVVQEARFASVDVSE